MKVKTANILCAISLCLMAAGAIFFTVLLSMGKIGECFSGGSDLGEGIGSACAALFLVFFSVLGLIAQAVAVIVGAVTVFSGKRRLSVTVGSVFVVIFTAIALVLYITSEVMLGSANGNHSVVTLVNASLWAEIFICVLNMAFYITAGAVKNRMIKARIKDAVLGNVNGEYAGEQNNKQDETHINNDDAEDASYSVSDSSDNK